MSALDVTFVESDAELDRLRPDWERLEGSGTSIFTCFDWQRAWWTRYGRGRNLRVAVARREGRVVGILPLYVGRAPLVPTLPARVLRLVGAGGDTSPDYLGPLVEGDGAPAALAALCRAAVRSAGWDGLDLTDVPEGSGVVEAMEAACRDAGVAAHRTSGWSISIAQLPAGWAEYTSTLSRKDMKNVRRARAACERAGARFFTWAGAPPLDALLARLAELHRMRWSGRADHFGFSSPEYVAFHRDVMHALAPRGRLRLYCLEVGSELVAIKYGYAFGGEVAHFQTGFDPRHQALSPGLALTSYAFEQAILEGVRLVDLLKGDYPHKAIWSNGRRATVGLRAYGAGARGRLLRLRREWLAHLRRPAPQAPAPVDG